MKLLLCFLIMSFSLNGFADTGLLSDAYAGTKIQFLEDVQLKQGQGSVKIVLDRCSISLHSPAYGRTHIPAGTELEFKRVMVIGARKVTNLSTGGKIDVPASIKITLSGLKSFITCGGDNILNFQTHELEYDERIKVIYPEVSRAYIFK